MYRAVHVTKSEANKIHEVFCLWQSQLFFLFFMYHGFISDEKCVFYILAAFPSLKENVSINFGPKKFKSLIMLLKNYCIANSFLVNFGNVWGQLYLKVAVDEVFSCVLRTMHLISFVYIATPKIFRIILSFLFVSQEVVLLAFISWKL